MRAQHLFAPHPGLEQMAAGKSWAVPSAATEGGAAVAVAEEAA